MNEPLALFLLRPMIFMNPAREFPIGVWATPLRRLSEDLQDQLISNPAASKAAMHPSARSNEPRQPNVTPRQDEPPNSPQATGAGGAEDLS
jgi:hypothetical protein